MQLINQNNNNNLLPTCTIGLVEDWLLRQHNLPDQVLSMSAMLNSPNKINYQNKLINTNLPTTSNSSRKKRRRQMPMFSSFFFSSPNVAIALWACLALDWSLQALVDPSLPPSSHGFPEVMGHQYWMEAHYSAFAWVAVEVGVVGRLRMWVSPFGDCRRLMPGWSWMIL